MDITARNGAHLLANGALTAAGFNIINATDLETYIKDIDSARPPTVPLLSNELVVLVHAVEKNSHSCRSAAQTPIAPSPIPVQESFF